MKTTTVEEEKKIGMQWSQSTEGFKGALDTMEDNWVTSAMSSRW